MTHDFTLIMVNEQPRQDTQEADDVQGAAAPGPGQVPVEEPVVTPDILPALATGPSVLYPAIVVPYVSGDEPDVRAVDDATSQPNRFIAIFGQQPSGEGEYRGALRQVGTVASILRMVRSPQGGVQAIIQGVARVRLLEVLQEKPYW